MSHLALVAGPRVAVETMWVEYLHLWEDRETHTATCKPRRQGLACALCYQTADRLDRAEKRLARAEQIDRGRR